MNYSDGLILQDGSGWTPLMIAASLKNAEGDPIVDLLLRKEADVNIKSVSGQVSFCQKKKKKVLGDQKQSSNNFLVLIRMLCTSPLPRPIFPPSKPSSPTSVVPELRINEDN